MAPVRTDTRVGVPRRGSRLRPSFACLRICVETDSSADAPSSRATFPAPPLSSFAARPMRSATSSRIFVRSTCFKSSTTRHSLCRPFGDLVLSGLHQVSVTQHTNQASILNDREPADLLALHHPASLLEFLIRPDGTDLTFHQVLGGFAARVMAFGSAADHDIPVGDHADQDLTVHDGHEADVFLLHRAGDVDHFVGLPGPVYDPRRRVSNFHARTSQGGRFCDFYCSAGDYIKV